MNKKPFALMALMVAVAMFSACGSQDVPDDSPAAPDYSGYNNVEYPDNGTNDKEDDASDIESKGNIIAGYTFTGSLDNRPILDGGDTTGILWDVDYYKMQLKRSDSVYITVSNHSSPFKFKFYGSCYSPSKAECADTTIVVNKTASLKYLIRSGHEQPGVDVSGSLAKFYVKVFNSLQIQQEPNKYLINIKVVRVI